MYDIGVGNGFLDMTTKAQTTERKKDKLDFIKSKNFCNAEDTIKKVKRQPTEWEKIFANDMTDMALISKIYKQLI